MMPRWPMVCRAALLTAVAASSATSVAVAAELLTPERYVERLHQIDAALAHGDRAQAASLSAAGADDEVSWPSGRLKVDPTINVLIASAASAQARLRIAAVLDECSARPAARSGAAASAAVSASRLARIAQQEADAQSVLRNGGSISGLPETDLPMLASWQDRMVDALRWLRDAIGRALEWLIKWLAGHPNDEKPVDSATQVLVISCVLVGGILAVAAVMAWRGWRTRSASVPRMVSAPAARGVDADPRSRAVDEWLEYAQQLFAAGRYREATRARFHALLVQCWSHGLIHHRVGKTNWEYALLLPAALAWRSQFQDLTRQYDCIWYGGRDDREAVEHFAGDAQEILRTLRPSAAVRP
jgi:hypothetical protein